MAAGIRDQDELATQLEAERRILDELREALARSDGRESELTETLDSALTGSDGRKPESCSTTEPWRQNVRRER